MKVVESIIGSDELGNAFKEIQKLNIDNILIKEGVINESYYNMVNTNSNNVYFDRLIKPMIIESAEELEQQSPGAGTVLVNLLNQDNVTFKSLIKDYDYLTHLKIKEIRKQLTKDWSKKIFDDTIINLKPNSRIFVKKSNAAKSSIKISNKPTFYIDFDNDYFLGRDIWKKQQARIYLLDGRIEKTSEIFHLLNKCVKDKIPTLLFCYGISNEVKNVIIKNLISNTIDLFPVVLKQSLSQINLLRDMSILTGQNVISAKLGDVFSVAIKKEAQLINNINISQGYIDFQKNCSKKTLNEHINFLNIKKKKCLHLDRTKAELYNKRISEISDNRIDIYLSQNNDLDKKEMRILHFLMILLTKDDIIIDLGKLSPYRYIDRLTLIKVLRKFYSLKKMKYNIKTGIILKESKR